MNAISYNCNFKLPFFPITKYTYIRCYTFCQIIEYNNVYCDSYNIIFCLMLDVLNCLQRNNYMI